MNKKIMFVMSALAILVGSFAGASIINAAYTEPSYDYSAYNSYSNDYSAYTSDYSYDESNYTYNENANYTYSSTDETAGEVASSSASSYNANCSSQTLYGAVFAQNATVLAWFEWGSSSSLGNSTPSQTFTSDSSYHYTLTGLNQNTTYYWRSAARKISGGHDNTIYGETMSFRTPNCVTPTPTPTPAPTPTPTPVTPSTNPFVGNYNVSCSTISGSVYNSNSPSSSLTIRIYDGVPGMANVIGTTSTNSSHSFSIATPNSIKNGNTYQVWATANDTLFDDFEYFNSSNCQTTSTAPSNVIVDSNNSSIVSNNNIIANGNTNSTVVNGNTNSNININSNNLTIINNGSNGDDDDSDNGDDDGNEEPDVTTRSATNIGTTSATLNGRVDGNGSSTRVWFEYSDRKSDVGDDEDTNHVSSGSGTKTFSSRITGLRRDTTYYFRAMAENDEGIDRGSILSFRTDDNGNDDEDDNDFNSVSAVTTPATSITSTSAQLNSLIVSEGNDTVETWFDWGTNLSLNNRTPSFRTDDSSFRNIRFITGLTPGVTYYFRAVAETSDDRSMGQILSFTTPFGVVAGASTSNNVVHTTTIVNRSTGEDSLIMLTLDCGSEFITENERRECIVKWENISGETLHDVVLQVMLPERMTFEAASDGDIKNDNHTLAYEIGKLEKGDEGKISFLFKTASVIEDDGLMVIVAQMVYTEPNGRTGDALAYSSHRTYSDGNALGAFAFGAGFFPNTLFGWLLLIILILALLLLAKQIANRNRHPQVIVTPPPSH